MMRLTIIGFGNQARSWALNLKDSGFPVRVALMPKSPSIPKAKEEGFEVTEIGSADFFSDEVFALLTPDHTHHLFLQSHGKSFSKGSVMLYAHGFSVLKNKFEKTYPHIQHVLYAPKSIGSELRKQFVLNGKLGAIYSLEHYQGDSEVFEKWLMKLASAMGINMGPYKASFKNETHADLYSEQGLLCSLLPYAAGEMFKNLVENGVEPELAYFECWHELKLIANAMVDKGPEGFFDLISPNALIGSEKGFKKLFTSEFNKNLGDLLKEIQDGSFDNEIDHADVEGTRKVIRERWQASPLMKTFHKMNQDT